MIKLSAPVFGFVKSNTSKLVFLVSSLIVYLLLFSPRTVNAQFPTPFVPCTETRPKEFHSLRPYQASPCPSPGPPGTSEPTRLYCGNDFLVSQQFEVLPNDAVSCDPPSGGYITCYFEQNKNVGLRVNLFDAELPIMGNTQQVSTQRYGEFAPNGVNFANDRRTNEYVSWYLNGVVYRAEEKPLAQRTSLGPGLPVIIMTKEQVDTLINYSGPLRKLLPQDIQNNFRGNNYSPRHDQIAYCSSFGQIVPCWPNLLLSATRISTARGEDIPRNLYVPFSSTEDRVGRVEAQDFFLDQYTNLQTRVPHPPSIPSDLVVSDEKLTLAACANNPNVDGCDDLYFAHMEENRQLSEHLMTTYLPQGVPVDMDIRANEPYYNNYRCDLENARWNTGDDLFGEYKGIGINGNFTYTANFTCSFEEPCFNPGVPSTCGEGPCNDACMQSEEVACGRLNDICLAQPEDFGCTPINANLCCFINVFRPCMNDAISYCDGVCSYKPCQVTARTAPFSIYTRTPLVDEIWSRLVQAPQSIFRRLMPKVAPPEWGLETYWPYGMLDLPGVTSARYDAYDTTGSGLTQAWAANIFRPGSQAELFIPHLGGIYDHFLQTIQRALRPYSGPGPRAIKPTRAMPQPPPPLCNWNPGYSSCDYYSTGVNRCGAILASDPSSNPLGDCPALTNIGSGLPIPVDNDILCTDPICENRKCNPYEYSLPIDYQNNCSVQPNTCYGECELIFQTSWDPDEYSNPTFNGCYFANADVCVRKDAASFGDNRCAAVCNRGCC